MRTALTPILFLVPANEPVTLAQALSIEPQGVVTKPLTHMVILESVAARLGAKDALGGLARGQGRPRTGRGPTGGHAPYTTPS